MILLTISTIYAINTYLVETSTNTIIDSIRAGDNSWAITITPDGRFVYVTNTFTDDVSVIDTSINMTVDSILVGNNPEGIAITSDGNYVYVTNSDSNTVSVIDTLTNEVVDTVNVGLSPQGIAMLNPSEPQIDLTITKSDSPDPVRVGEELTYTVTVVNNGPAAATDAELTDTLPLEAVYLSASSTKGSCSEAGGVVTCNLTTIGNGETVTATIAVMPNTAGNICNSAVISANEIDSNPSDNTVIECTTVLAQLTPQEMINDLIDYINDLNIVVRLILIPLLLTARLLLNIGLERIAILILYSIIPIVLILMLIRLLSNEEGQEIIDQIEMIISLIQLI